MGEWAIEMVINTDTGAEGIRLCFYEDGIQVFSTVMQPVAYLELARALIEAGGVHTIGQVSQSEWSLN